MKQQDLPYIKPPRLSPGNVIGIAAPAGPYEQTQLEKGVAVIENMGFKVRVPKNLQRPKNFLAASDDHRAKLLMDLFADPEVAAIVCARGGYGSLRILERLDWSGLQKHPKIFVGFSDISALHAALMARCSLVVFHGPMLVSLGQSSPQTQSSLLKTLTIDQPVEIRPASPNRLCPGTAEGIVAGGNLATLCHLLGTPFAPLYKDTILLLEDITEAPYKIDRMLYQMKLAGCLAGVKGVVLGRFHKSGSYREICDIVLEIFKDDDVPILAGFEIGHNGTNLTVPLGLSATLDTEKGCLRFHEPATSL